MTYSEICAAFIPLPPDTDKGCADCGNSASFMWPVTNHNNAEPYCKRCLEQAQFRLAVALGIATTP